MAKVKKPNANARAMGCLASGIAYLIIGLVAIFADVMLVFILWSAFPTNSLIGGFLTACAVGGAFATSLSLIGLVVAKSYVFRPGSQLVFSWLFTAVEILVMVVNVIAAFAYAHHNLGFLAYWVDYGAPSSPFVAMIGWIILKYLSPERAQLHAQMEMDDEKQQAELDYQRAEHEAHMTVKHVFLGAYQGFLMEEARAPHNLDKLREGARRMSQSVIGGIIGSPVGVDPSRIVDSTLAQPAQLSASATVTPPQDTPPAPQPPVPPPTSPELGDGPSIAEMVQAFKSLFGGKQKEPETSPLVEPASLSQEGQVAMPESLNGLNGHQSRQIQA